MNARFLIQLLERPLLLDWRAHGIGFIKAYVDPAKTQRVNIYHQMFVVPGISLHHDHPWKLESHIAAGELTNRRYVRSDPEDEGATCFMEGQIDCVNFQGMSSWTKKTWLHGMTPEVYTAGMRYEQEPDEIHATTAIDGTVTVMRRSPPVGDGTARIFWPAGTEWVDATRKLRGKEIMEATGLALEKLRSEA